ncbi:MAG: GIY-YIG nuclease family protein [Litorimonas sp.]
MDPENLLAPPTLPAAVPDDDDAILAALGVEADVDVDDLTELRHVRSSAEKRAAEEIAKRDPCPDFETFKPLFEQVQAELDAGTRETRKFEVRAEIEPGRFFIVNGQKAYVAEMGALERTDYEQTDARLRLIYENGTESDLLMRSFQRALHRDGLSRRITDPSAGPLFATSPEEGDQKTGTIYVLSSLSDDPWIAGRRDLFHKIGVTGGTVEKRIADAENQPTFLMAGVKVERTAQLLNITRSRFETLLHRVLEQAKADVEITDRFGKAVSPREWFLVPLFIIDEVIDLIVEGQIGDYRYDPENVRMVPRN